MGCLYLIIINRQFFQKICTLSSEGQVEFGAVGRGRGAGSVRGGRGGWILHLILLITLGIGGTARGRGAVRGGGGSQPAGQAGGSSKF